MRQSSKQFICKIKLYVPCSLILNYSIEKTNSKQLQSCSTGGGGGVVNIFSSPEHEVLMVSYCDRAVSVVNFLPCVRSRGHIFSPIIMKLSQNVCLIKILGRV